MKPYQRSIFFRTNRLFVAATLGLLAPLAQADTFTWTNTAGGSWAEPTNWSGGTLPTTTNDTADFSTLDITTANTIVSLNGNQSINKLVFADTTPSANWTLNAGSPSNSTLTLGGTAPEISVLNRTLTLSAPLAGSAGLTKTGAGTLIVNNTSFSGGLMVQTGNMQARRGIGSAFSLGDAANTVTINSTGNLTTGGQLYLAAFGAPTTPVTQPIVIQGTGESAGNTNAALILQGWETVGENIGLNINSSITLTGTSTYRIRTFGAGGNIKDGVNSINGGITRSGVNPGTLILESYDFYGYAANPIVGNTIVNTVTTIVNSAIQNNGGDVTVVGNDSSILILQADGNNIGTFTMNYNRRDENVVKLGIDDALKTNQNLTLTRGTFDLAGFNQTVNALSGVAVASLITNSGSTDSKLTIGNGGGGATFAGVIQDGATHKTALEKTGIGTATLTGANTYAGATTITGGTLAISGAGAITNSPTIIVGASTTFNVSAVTGGYTLGAGQTLSGTGTVSGAMTVAGTLSPGNSPGSITTGNQTWLNGGDYNFQMLDAEGVAGTGFDQIQITGTLNLSSLTAGGFNINLWSLSSIGPDENGNALNFDNTIDQSWTILTTSGGITDFDAADFVINVGANNGTAGFSNALGGGSFSLGTASNNLVLNFTAIPEPGAALLGGLGLLALLRRRR